MVDVLKMKMYRWKPEGGVPEVLDIPADQMDKAKDLNAKLIEAAAENDDTLMEKFFEEGSLDEDQMRAGIRAGIISRGMFPVFCVAGKKDMGIRRMMEFVGNVAPNPTEMPAPVNSEGNEVKCDPNGKTSVFVFKTTVEEHVGEVLYFKVMSGKITEGMDLVNTNKNAKERLSQFFSPAGKNREKLTEMVAGDIGAMVKLKETKTYHTLNDKDLDWTFPATQMPDPRFRTAIKPVDASGRGETGRLLVRKSQEDPSIIVEYSKELKQTMFTVRVSSTSTH
jgi:Translation elongation factors (GTPases)